MFSEILRKTRKEANLTQKKLADMLFVDCSTITKWETGKATPDLDKLQKLSKILNVSVGYLTGTDSPKQKGFKIPVLGKVAAGIPIEAIEDILDWEEIPEDMAKRGEYFALKISGDSMEPRIWLNDVVIVRRQNWIDDGKIGIVMVNGYDAVCKKVKFNKEGMTLISLNAKYEPVFFTRYQIENEPVNIIGEVVEVRGKLT